MTQDDKDALKILVAIFAVLGVTIAIMYFLSHPAEAMDDYNLIMKAFGF